MTRFGLLFSVCLLACGPSLAGDPPGGKGQSDSAVEPKLDVPQGVSSSASSGGDGCTEVVVGDLEVDDESDFEWLRTVRAQAKLDNTNDADHRLKIISTLPKTTKEGPAEHLTSHAFMRLTAAKFGRPAEERERARSRSPTSKPGSLGS